MWFLVKCEVGCGILTLAPMFSIWIQKIWAYLQILVMLSRHQNKNIYLFINLFYCICFSECYPRRSITAWSSNNPSISYFPLRVWNFFFLAYFKTILKAKTWFAHVTLHTTKITSFVYENNVVFKSSGQFYNWQIKDVKDNLFKVWSHFCMG